MVGIEVKKLMDAVGCMFSGRLADHQIPLMKAQYDVVYLVIEGVYRPCPKSGVLQYLKLFPKESDREVQCGKWIDASHGNQRLLYSSFESWLSSLAVQGSILVRSTSSVDVTAALILALYNWWQKSSHRSFHTMQEPGGETAELSRPTMMRRIIALLPRVGWQRSAILAKRFESTAEMCQAPPESFLIENEIAIPTATKIWEALHGVQLDR
jgi:ERCC4-type nuclease